LIAACLSVALTLATANNVVIGPGEQARLEGTCRTMAAVPVRAIREDRDGRLAGCTALASVRYRLPHDALPAILFNEGGWLGAVVRNKDRSTDHGPFQVNSQWVWSVKKIFGYDTLTEAERGVTYNPCVNAEMAAIILARCIRDKRDLYAGLGCYASPTPHRADAYARRIVGNAKKIAGSKNSQF
jgi:hypothetical protein